MRECQCGRLPLEINGGGLLCTRSRWLLTPTRCSLVPDSPTYHPLLIGDLGCGIRRAGNELPDHPGAQVLTAEPPVNLPAGVIIDLSSAYPATNGQPLSNPVNSGGNYDILFAPSGGVVGVNSTSPIYLVLRQTDGSNVAPYGADLTAYFATIISVEPRTGFIAAQPVAPGANPYQYTQDGQSSGM